MAKKVSKFMTQDLVKLDCSAPIAEAAREMRAANVGAIIVQDDGKLSGIVTDRDIVIRAVAAGIDTQTTPISDICSEHLATLSPDDDVDDAIDIMRKRAVRRIPVVESDGTPVGIVSLGDLAQAGDARSVLGQISSAPPTQ